MPVRLLILIIFQIRIISGLNETLLTGYGNEVSRSDVDDSIDYEKLEKMVSNIISETDTNEKSLTTTKVYSEQNNKNGYYSFLYKTKNISPTEDLNPYDLTNGTYAKEDTTKDFVHLGNKIDDNNNNNNISFKVDEENKSNSFKTLSTSNLPNPSTDHTNPSTEYREIEPSILEYPQIFINSIFHEQINLSTKMDRRIHGNMRGIGIKNDKTSDFYFFIITVNSYKESNHYKDFQSTILSFAHITFESNNSLERQNRNEDTIYGKFKTEIHCNSIQNFNLEKLFFNKDFVEKDPREEEIFTFKRIYDFPSLPFEDFQNEENFIPLSALKQFLNNLPKDFEFIHQKNLKPIENKFILNKPKKFRVFNYCTTDGGYFEIKVRYLGDGIMRVINIIHVPDMGGEHRNKLRFFNNFRNENTTFYINEERIYNSIFRI